VFRTEGNIGDFGNANKQSVNTTKKT